MKSKLQILIRMELEYLKEMTSCSRMILIRPMTSILPRYILDSELVSSWPWRCGREDVCSEDDLSFTSWSLPLHVCILWRGINQQKSTSHGARLYNTHIHLKLIKLSNVAEIDEYGMPSGWILRPHLEIEAALSWQYSLSYIYSTFDLQLNLFSSTHTHLFNTALNSSKPAATSLLVSQSSSKVSWPFHSTTLRTQGLLLFINTIVIERSQLLQHLNIDSLSSWQVSSTFADHRRMSCSMPWLFWQLEWSAR